MSVKKLIILSFLIGFVVFFASAEILNSTTWGYKIDLPEGYYLDSQDGNNGFLFKYADFPVNVVIRAYEKTRFADSSKAMESAMNSLNTEYEAAAVDWNYNDCIITNFQFLFDGEINSGWGVSCNLAENKGYIVILAYAPDSNYDTTCEQFLFSVLDSLCIEQGDFYCSGPITAFAFPKTEKVSYSAKIAGKEIKFSLDKDAVEADSFVIEREYAILTLYQQSNQWKEAWQRYYRQIFKNACCLVRESAFEIYSELSKIAKNDEELCQLLLTWAQNFSYERRVRPSDFTPITAILTGEGSDCDSRSMLLATLLYHFNFKTCIFVSAEYSHAVLGVVLNKNGAKINVDGTDFLLGETTAKVDIGLIASTMNNTDLWIPVILEN